eukprot:gene1179-1516_t
MPQLQDVVKEIRRAVPSVQYIFGCSSFGVLGSSAGGAVEVEGEPGLSLSLAALPGCELSVMHSLRSSIPTEDASPEAWADLVGMSPLEQLQPSPPPSAAASADEDEGGLKPGDEAAAGTGLEEQAGQGHSAKVEAAAATTSTSSEASSSSKAQESSHSSPTSQQDFSATDNTTTTTTTGVRIPSQQQQQQKLPDVAVNFLVLCDPRFQQSKQLLAGLDFAFPNSNKVGPALGYGGVASAVMGLC